MDVGITRSARGAEDVGVMGWGFRVRGSGFADEAQRPLQSCCKAGLV